MNGDLELVLVPRTSDLGGGFKVGRVLPSSARRMVGPFVFLDQMGPVKLASGQGLDVRPHPHIGLATVTYLLEGQIRHRDSLGNSQLICPGELNWMTAGSGIVHSERTPRECRRAGPEIFGLQAWAALPRRYEDAAPSFVHYGAGDIPAVSEQGLGVRLLVGELLGLRSPVATLSSTLYADVELAPPSRLQIPAFYEERAVYVLRGEIEADGESYGPSRLLVFRSGVPIVLSASVPSRFVVLGGEAMDGPRHLWWNFVSSSRERVEQAKADWRSGRLGRVPGDPDLVPLPEEDHRRVARRR